MIPLYSGNGTRPDLDANTHPNEVTSPHWRGIRQLLITERHNLTVRWPPFKYGRPHAQRLLTTANSITRLTTTSADCCG